MLTLWWEINESLNDNRFSCTFCVCINAALNQINFIMMDVNWTHLTTGQPALSYHRVSMFPSEILVQGNMTVQARCEFLYFRLLQKYFLQGELRLNMCPVCSRLQKNNKNELLKSPPPQILLSWVFLLSGKKAWMVFWLVLSSLCPSLPLSQNLLFNNHNISNFRIKTYWTADFTCKFVLFTDKWNHLCAKLTWS